MIFLTFDDGPQENITPWVLDLLKKENVKAQFFVVGNNLIRHPEIAKLVIQQGHTICNHTLNHKKGWVSSNEEYAQEIAKTQRLIQELYQNCEMASPRIPLFRPPYGRIKKSQLIETIKNGFEVIMWWQLSCDYDKNVHIQRSTDSLVNNLKNGSIVVFHDSAKAAAQLKQILPTFIRLAKEKGFEFGLLADELPLKADCKNPNADSNF